jgi:hypothetical protein
MDHWDGIIIGAAIAAVATVLATKLISSTPIGGGSPNQTAVGSANAKNNVLIIEEPARTSYDAAPVVQNTPITEAAYSSGVVGPYAPAFGRNTNQNPSPAYDVVLPQ